MRILVDADAFPGVLRRILFKASERLEIPVVMVANKYIRTPDSPLVSTLLAAAGPDEADDKIVEEIQPGELVITADIPLADRVVEKGAYAISPRGDLFTVTNIKQRLATRDLMAQLRSQGMETGGPPGFSQKDCQVFANQLDRFLAKHCRR
ncbi:MAG: YaiI/YqxD family protein [Lentisphaeria bacterium]|nr:YaiI/YqxD family protein [Lentisphaeria bacterium]